MIDALDFRLARVQIDQVYGGLCFEFHSDQLRWRDYLQSDLLHDHPDHDYLLGRLYQRAEDAFDYMRRTGKSIP